MAIVTTMIPLRASKKPARHASNTLPRTAHLDRAQRETAASRGQSAGWNAHELHAAPQRARP
eukprot:11193442-Lingulodinium_polyedra.AAC.1